MNNIKEFKDLTDFSSDKFLAINSCGFSRYEIKPETVLRTKGRKDYHFVYVLKGKCTAAVKEKEVALEAGDLLFYKPGEKHLYSYEKGTEVFWIHFTGTAAEELQGMLDFESITRPGYDRILINLFYDIINNFKPDKNNLISISYLIQFCVTAKKMAEKKLRVLDERIEKVINFMNENYNQNHSLNFYARMCNLSTTGFAHLFKKSTGISPHKFILNVRLRQIRYLLVYSDMNINEIALETGFDDPLYLSRLFTKNEGISPREYVKNYKYILT